MEKQQVALVGGLGVGVAVTSEKASRALLFCAPLGPRAERSAGRRGCSGDIS